MHLSLSVRLSHYSHFSIISHHFRLFFVLRLSSSLCSSPTLFHPHPHPLYLTVLLLYFLLSRVNVSHSSYHRHCHRLVLILDQCVHNPFESLDRKSPRRQTCHMKWMCGASVTHSGLDRKSGRALVPDVDHHLNLAAAVQSHLSMLETRLLRFIGAQCRLGFTFYLYGPAEGPSGEGRDPTWQFVVTCPQRSLEHTTA